jgi:hypothetical protein
VFEFFEAPRKRSIDDQRAALNLHAIQNPTKSHRDDRIIPREPNRNIDDLIQSIPEHISENLCEPNRASGDSLAAPTGHEAMTRLDEDLACLTRAKPEGESRVKWRACRSDSHRIPCRVRKSRGNSEDHTSANSTPATPRHAASPPLPLAPAPRNTSWPLRRTEAPIPLVARPPDPHRSAVPSPPGSLHAPRNRERPYAEPPRPGSPRSGRAIRRHRHRPLTPPLPDAPTSRPTSHYCRRPPVRHPIIDKMIRMRGEGPAGEVSDQGGRRGSGRRVATAVQVTKGDRPWREQSITERKSSQCR